MIKNMIMVTGAAINEEGLRIFVGDEGTVVIQPHCEGSEIPTMVFDKREWRAIVEFIERELREPTMGGRE